MPRARTPTAVRILTGNPGNQPWNLNEPKIPTADPSFDDVPPSLVDDATAAAEWRRLAPLLRQARVVTEADRNALLAACQQWSVYQHALTQAPPDRRVLRSPTNDLPIQNPYIRIADKALLQCIRLWESLGLTPSARSKVVAAKAADAGDPFAEFDEAPQVPRVKKGPTLRGRAYADDEPRPH